MSGEEPGQQPSNRDSPPEDTFALIGHEIRAELVQVLGRDEVSLSELRSRLAADVEPSQLHYHLKQLVGHFVEKTDDGYRLNSVGVRLSWTLRAGGLDRREDQMTVAANFDCHDCQVPVEVIFDNGQVSIVCPKCDQRFMLDYFHLPLDMFDDEADAFSHFKQYQTLKMLFMARKICFNCANRLTPTFFHPDESGTLDEYKHLKVVIGLGCNQCGAGWWQSVGMALRADPGLISFCYEHGLDILSTPHWELEFAMTDEHVTVQSTDPWEVALAVTLDGDTLELVVDGNLNVIERTRMNSAVAQWGPLIGGIRSGEDFIAGWQTGDDLVLPPTEACLLYLRQQRWPNGVRCPDCDSSDTTKKGTTSKAAQRYRCGSCDRTFNDLTATVFAGHQLALPEMFYIIRQLNRSDTTEIADHLDRSYRRILDFVHEIQATSDTDFDSEG